MPHHRVVQGLCRAVGPSLLVASGGSLRWQPPPVAAVVQSQRFQRVAWERGWRASRACGAGEGLNTPWLKEREAPGHSAGLWAVAGRSASRSQRQPETTSAQAARRLPCDGSSARGGLGQAPPPGSVSESYADRSEVST